MIPKTVNPEIGSGGLFENASGVIRPVQISAPYVGNRTATSAVRDRFSCSPCRRWHREEDHGPLWKDMRCVGRYGIFGFDRRNGSFVCRRLRALERPRQKRCPKETAPAKGGRRGRIVRGA